MDCLETYANLVQNVLVLVQLYEYTTETGMSGPAHPSPLGFGWVLGELRVSWVGLGGPWADKTERKCDSRVCTVTSCSTVAILNTEYFVLHTVVPGTVLGLGGSWAQPSRNTWVLGGFGPVISSVPVYVGPMGRVK